MTRGLLVLSVCLSLLGLASVPVAGQTIAGCRASKSFTSDQVEKNHWKRTGAVEIECETFKLYADEVELFTDRHKVVARGNVVYTEGTARIAGDRAEFDTEQKTGT